MNIAAADAIIWNGRTFSWHLLNTYVHSTSRRLKEVGVKPGMRVLVEACPTVGTIVVFLSLWRIGAVVCPFNSQQTFEMAQDIQHKCQPFLVLAKSKVRAYFPGLRSFTIDDMICIEPVEEFRSGSAVSSLLSSFSDQGFREATIIFTSGSAGGDKAVLHTLDSHIANAAGSAELIEFAAGDRWLMSLPLYGISGISIIFRALHGGGAIVFSESDLVSAIQKYQPTHISLVPTQFLHLTEMLPAEDWKSFKAILIGGAPISDKLIDKAVELNLPVYLTYELTETASQVATGPVLEVSQLGTQVLGQRELKIIDNEICVRGAVLFKGYVNGSELSLPVDEAGWFHTGDTGEYTNGFLKVIGRKSRLFISGGENIHL